MRVVLLGESGVGKSALVTRLTEDRYSAESDVTVGTSTATWVCEIDAEFGKRQRLHVRIIDVGGSEKTRAAQRQFLKGASAALFVFDLCDRSSFSRISTWIRDIKEVADHPAMVKVLVGNKLDLATQDSLAPVSATIPFKRAVREDEARSFAEQMSMHYIETSALDSQNVRPLFLAVGDKIVDLLGQGVINHAQHDIHGVRYAKVAASGRQVGGNNQHCPQLGFFGQWCDGC